MIRGQITRRPITLSLATQRQTRRDITTRGQVVASVELTRSQRLSRRYFRSLTSTLTSTPPPTFALALTLALIFSLSMSLGCSGRFPPPPQFKADAARYHRALNERSEQVKGLSGELAVELWEKSKRVALRQLFAAEPPHKLRMDTLTPFEAPLATLIYNKDLIALHDIERAQFAVGVADAERFERLTRVRIEPSSMSALLSGQTPRLTSEGGVVTWDREQGRSRLELIHGAERQLIFFRERDLTPRLVELYRDGKLELKLSLARYTEAEPKIPRRLRIEIPRRGIKVEIELKEMTLNPELPDAAFMIEAPPGASTVNL